jgi:regulator of nonsense transcripts 2
MADEFAAQLAAMEALEALRRNATLCAQLRETNTPPALKGVREGHEKNRGNLKSDLKKCTTFVKKIRTITPEGLAQCVREVGTLNMSLYLEEIVAAIVESNFKSTDVPPLVKLCVQLHQMYSEFTPPLLGGLREALLEVGEENGKRRRIQLRFLVELFQAGVARDEEFFLQLLRHLLGKASRSKPSAGQKAGPGGVDVAGLVTFVKYAAEPLLGHVSKKTLGLVAAAGSSAAELEGMGLRTSLASPKVTAELGQLVSDAAENMSLDLVKTFAEFKRCEKRSEKEAAIHGSLTEAKQAELNGLRKLYEKLLSAVTSLCECLDIDPPVLREEKEDADSGGGGLSVWDGSSVSADYGPFGDAESKHFYDELPDLLVMVPLTVLGLSGEQAAGLKEEWRQKRDAAFLQGEGDEAALLPADTDTAPAETEGGGAEEEPADETAAAATAAAAESADGDGSVPSGTTVLRLNVLLTEKLPECNNRQKTDDFSSSFCYVSSRKARKSLVAQLSRIPKGRSELIPHYARIVASLSRLYGDVAPPVLESLYGCFIGKFKAKQQFDFDGKSRNIRYIGELIKFSIAPPIMAFRIFNKLFLEFVNQNVLLCAILLETCGRFLYLLPYTHARVEAILDTVLRLRRAKNLDSNCQMALESAYFTVKPPERKELRKKKVLTRLQQYIRHIFSSKLSNAPFVIDKAIRELRKLPWSQPEEKVELHVIKACLRVAKTKYVSIPLAVDAISGLGRYHPRLHVSACVCLYMHQYIIPYFSIETKINEVNNNVIIIQ